MLKGILYLIFILIATLLINIDIFKQFGYGILVSFVIRLVEIILENHSNLLLWLKCNSVFRDKDIRISISYLFRIKVKGKYLLVRGDRIKNQFQPVGGVYKRLPRQ